MDKWIKQKYVYPMKYYSPLKMKDILVIYEKVDEPSGHYISGNKPDIENAVTV